MNGVIDGEKFQNAMRWAVANATLLRVPGLAVAQRALQAVFTVEERNEEIERTEEAIIGAMLDGLRRHYHPEDQTVAIAFVPASVAGIAPGRLNAAYARADSPASTACALIILRDETLAYRAFDRAAKDLMRGRQP
jgi:hypothetical protein